MLNTPLRRRTLTPSGGKQITKQSFKDECDINQILSQYKKTGIINHISNQTPQYSELPDQFDYQQSMNLIINADEAFATLPSVVRRYFDNNPQLLLAALNNPEMAPKLQELGILNKPDAPQPAGNPAPTNPSVPLATEPKLP